MEDLQSIVLLIDADNTQLSKLEDIIREISTHGRIVVKRAYGNWKKDVLKNWEEEIKRLAIKAEQQFDYVSGKMLRIWHWSLIRSACCTGAFMMPL